MSYTPASSSFPTSLDVPTSPSATSDTYDFDHAGLETFQNEAITALQTKVGIDSSADTDSLDYRIDTKAPIDDPVFTGTVTVESEITTANATNPGNLDIGAGDSSSGNNVGGHADFHAGVGHGSGPGGIASLFAGDGGETGDGGNVSISAGFGGTTSGLGGDVDISGGDTLSSSNGGIVSIFGGDSQSGTDGYVVLGNPGKVRIQKEGSSLEAIFDANSIASTDKTFTFPNATGTFVLEDNTATLTNKTLTSPQVGGDLDLDDATGNITVQGADPKRGLYVPASAMYPSITQPCAVLTQVESSTNKVNIKVLDFDGAGSAKEYAEFAIQSPSYWDASTVTFQFIWYATAGSGTVNWEAQGLALSDDDALDTAYGTLQEVTDTLLATGDVHITSETSALTIAGSPVAGDWLQFRIARDPANDTNTSDARLMGVRVRFGVTKYTDS